MSEPAIASSQTCIMHPHSCCSPSRLGFHLSMCSCRHHFRTAAHLNRSDILGMHGWDSWSHNISDHLHAPHQGFINILGYAQLACAAPCFSSGCTEQQSGEEAIGLSVEKNRSFGHLPPSVQPTGHRIASACWGPCNSSKRAAFPEIRRCPLGLEDLGTDMSTMHDRCR